MANGEMISEILEIYKLREQRRFQVSHQVGQTLVQLSLNLPANAKLPPGANGLFSWGLKQVLELLAQIESCSHGQDLLGPWALLGTSIDADTLKRQAVVLENSHPAAVLLDVDIYDRNGRKFTREFLGLPQRRCLICHESARDCQRMKRHAQTELNSRTNKLLASFRN